MRVAISCSIRSGSRASWKQPVKRSTKPMARSVAPSSRAPASDVIAPPVNEATTERPSTGAKTSCSGLHCVGIGEFLWPEPSRCSTTTLTYPEPRCTSACEIYGLALLWVEYLNYPLIIGEFCKYGAYAGKDATGKDVSICSPAGEVNYE